MKILERLNPNNTVSFNRPIAHALGLGAAVVYSALIAKQVYYEQREMLDSEGFFYSTIADLEESTSLSKRQQSSAINALVEAGLVECEKRVVCRLVGAFVCVMMLRWSIKFSHKVKIL